MSAKPKKSGSSRPPSVYANKSEMVSKINQWLPKDWHSLNAGIVCVSNNANTGAPEFNFPTKHGIERWIIVFEEVPIDPVVVQTWRDWAMNEGAIDVKLTMAPTKGLTKSGLHEILGRHCADWRKPVPNRENLALGIGSRVKMPHTPTPKDDPFLLTMMFGSMGDLLTQLEIAAKRFRAACVTAQFDQYKRKKTRDEAARRLAIKKPKDEDLPAFETGLEKVIDHFPKILLYGESGVGKTLIASYLQARASLESEAGRPLRVPIPEYLGKEESFEYDLFGYAAGTYTGGRSDGSPGKLISHVGGVIFLDEIGEANDTIQSKMLAFLDDYRVGPRGWDGEKFHCPVLIVAATNKNLDEEVANKRFKGDLLARFTDRLTIPPLRDRMVDIEFILDCLLQRESLNPGRYVTEIGAGALEAIRNREFKGGNFRELEDWFRGVCSQARREGRNYLVAGDVQPPGCELQQKVMRILLNTRHLIEQASDPRRIPHFNGEPFQLTANDLERWRNAILGNAPFDWRFTERGRDFVLTVITESHQIKFVGNSRRDTHHTQALANGVKQLARGLEAGNEPDKALLQKLGNSYIEAECDTRAEIEHQLKSVLAAHMASRSALDLMSNEIDQDESVVLAQSNVARNIAQRPNAILIDLDGRPIELWVRQGNPYVRLYRSSRRSHSYCIFAKLTPSGIEAGTGQVWKVSSGGVLERRGDATCSPTPRPDTEAVPQGFRSENYWRVPLSLDAWRLDLEEKQRKLRKENASVPQSVIHLLAAINHVREQARMLNLESDM